MLRFRLVPVILILVTITTLPARSQISIQLGGDATQELTIFKGDIIRDTVFEVNYLGSAKITSISSPKEAPFVFEPFYTPPLNLGLGPTPLGILTISDSGLARFYIGYTRGSNGPSVDHFNLHVHAFERGSNCLRMDSLHSIDSVSLLQYEHTNFHITNTMNGTVSLDSLMLRSATPDYFWLQLSKGLPISLDNSGSMVTATVGFGTQGLYVAPKQFDATLTAYAAGCNIATAHVRVSTRSIDTTYDANRDTIFLIGNTEGVVRRSVIRNNTGLTKVLRAPQIVGYPAFSIVGMSFPIETIVVPGIRHDTVVWNDSLRRLDTISLAHADTILGHRMQPGESDWIDIEYSSAHTKADSLYFAWLVIDSIGEPNRMLFGMSTAVANVPAVTPTLPVRLMVTYDANGRARIESPGTTLGTLEVFDLLGREVRTFPSAAEWLITDLPAGDYIVRYNGRASSDEPVVVSAKVVVGR